MKTLAVLIVVLVVFVVGVQVGTWHGYSMGWSDAHCGEGNNCESGQE